MSPAAGGAPGGSACCEGRCAAGPFAAKPGGTPGDAAAGGAAPAGPRPSSSSRVRALGGIAGRGAAPGTALANAAKLNGCSGFAARWDAALVHSEMLVQHASNACH